MKKVDTCKSAPVPEAAVRSEAARLLGSIRTEKKIAATAEVGRRYGNRDGRPRKSLSEVECTCTAGPDAPHESHKSYCLRGQAVKRRQAKGLPLE